MEKYEFSYSLLYCSVRVEPYRIYALKENTHTYLRWIPYYISILSVLYPIIQGISAVMLFHVMKLQKCNMWATLRYFYPTDTTAAFNEDSVDIYFGLESPKMNSNAGKHHSNAHIGSLRDGLSQIYIFLQVEKIPTLLI